METYVDIWKIFRLIGLIDIHPDSSTFNPPLLSILDLTVVIIIIIIIIKKWKRNEIIVISF